MLARVCVWDQAQRLAGLSNLPATRLFGGEAVVVGRVANLRGLLFVLCPRAAQSGGGAGN